jgi:hypothetical protein
MSDDLPEILKIFYITFRDGEKFIAETIDISRTGISFNVKMPNYYISEFQITLEPMDRSFKIDYEFVYAKPVGQGIYRLSIKFSESHKDFEKMKPYLKNLID